MLALVLASWVDKPHMLFLKVHRLLNVSKVKTFVKLLLIFWLGGLGVRIPVPQHYQQLVDKELSQIL